MILGKLLDAAKINLEGYESHHGLRLRAANKESGREIIIPNIVATKAIFNVSITPIQAVEQVKSSHPGSVHTGYA